MGRLPESGVAVRKALKLNMNPGRISVTTPKGWATFEPKGKMYMYGAMPNPEDPDVAVDNAQKPLLSVRIIVGFSKEDGTTWMIDDVMSIVRRVREEQAAAPDSSFLLQ